MKKILNYTFLLLASVALALTGCKDEELVFDHERQQWETQTDAILLEFIAPAGTAYDEQIYITGEFNKGDKYFLDKTKNDKKWAIYLYESDFTAEGKTLKDGFTFGSVKNGLLCDMKGKVDTLTTDITFGQWTNLWGMRWESFFKSNEDEPIVPGEYEHLYIIGNVEGTGWTPADVLEFEMVGTDIFRGEFTFSAATSYFAILTAKGESNDDWATVNAARWGASDALLTEGTVLDLKLQDGSDQCVTIAQGTYTITVNMAEKQIVIGNGDWDKPELPSKYEHLYILGNVEGTGWTPAEPLELKKVGRDLFRGEFTFVPDGTNTICYFAFATEKGASNDDWPTLNAARWGGGELVEGEYLPLTLQTTSDVTVTIAPGTYTITVNMIFNEAVIGEGDWSDRKEPEPDPTPDPTPDPQPTTPDSAVINLYILDSTVDLAANDSVLSMYAWGTSECFGGWPGAKIDSWKKYTFLGTEFYHYAIDCVVGNEFNLILNNKAYYGEGETDHGNLQYDVMTVKATGTAVNYYIEVGDAKATELVATPKGLLRK